MSITIDDCACMHAVKKRRRLELKCKGYRDGIKRNETR